jgi:hypothetical protein
MNFIKYGIYIFIILIVALLFEQIVTFLYDVTLRGVAGDLSAYIILVGIWVVIFIVARAFLDKRVNPRASRFVLWGSALHVGGSLAIYFYTTNPVLLLAFPILIAVIFLTRQKKSSTQKMGFRFHPIHPLLIDKRGGLCVVRNGSDGFHVLKFIHITPPLPVKDLLLYLFHQQIEGTLEIYRLREKINFCFGLMTHDRNYEVARKHCLDQYNQLRQFLKKLNITFRAYNDYLNTLKAFYAPYFLYKPSILTERGQPLTFPKLSSFERELCIDDGFSELTFSVHAIHPEFKPNRLYEFIETLKDAFFLQFHLSPLTESAVLAREERFNRDYKDSLRRLTQGLEGNSEFQAAAHLFNQTGEAEKENLMPLLDQRELEKLHDIKMNIKQVKNGRYIGLWGFNAYLIATSVLAQTLAIKLGGSKTVVSPQALCLLACRIAVGNPQVIDSKDLATVLPNTV